MKWVYLGIMFSTAGAALLTLVTVALFALLDQWWERDD